MRFVKWWRSAMCTNSIVPIWWQCGCALDDSAMPLMNVWKSTYYSSEWMYLRIKLRQIRPSKMRSTCVCYGVFWWLECCDLFIEIGSCCVIVCFTDCRAGWSGSQHYAASSEISNSFFGEISQRLAQNNVKCQIATKLKSARLKSLVSTSRTDADHM